MLSDIMSAETNNQHNFSARIWYLASDGVIEINTFSFELEPMTSLQCGVADWAHEHLAEMGSGICDLLEIDQEKDWQIVFNGRMRSYSSFNGEITEYDEDMEIIGEPMIAEIPREYRELLVSNSNELES